MVVWKNDPDHSTPLDADHLIQAFDDERASERANASSTYGRKVSIVVDAAGGGDYSTIQAAMVAVPAGGADVLVKRGTYTLTAEINPPAGTTLRGEGRGTVLKVGNAVNGNALAVIGGVSGVTISDLAIDGNKVNQTGNGSGIVCNTGCSQVRVSNVYVKDVNGYGIVCYPGATDLIWSGCFVQGARDESYEVGGGSSAAITNCISMDSGKNGFLIWLNAGATAKDVTVTNCVAKATGGGCVGFLIEGAGTAGGVSSVTVSGCSASSCSGPGFKVQNTTTDVTLTGNTARSNGGSGFHVNTTAGVVLVGNVSSKNDESGILVITCTDFVVTSNICRANGQDATQTNLYNGITIFNTGDRGVVAHNRCYDDQVTKTQMYGIRTLNTIGASVVIGPNILDGNGTTGQLFSFGGATAPSCPVWKKLTAVTVNTAGSSIAHGLPYIPLSILVCMTSAGNIYKGGTSDGTVVVLKSDVDGRTADIYVG
jgi:parallel beta-helix repeat protein